MRLPPAVILAGVARTLEEDVLPAVASRAARGLVFTALELLANVQDLVEWRAAVRQSTLERPVSARCRAIILRAATMWLRGKPVARRRDQTRTTAQYYPTMTSSGTLRAAAIALSEVAEPVFLPASMSAI